MIIPASFHDKKLLEAIKMGRLTPAASALASGANPNIYDPASMLPVSHFCASQNRFDMLRELLSCGASVTAKDRDQRSLMRRCVEDGQDEGVRMLIGHQANLAEQDHARDTLLHSACARGKKGLRYFDIARMLVDAGSNLATRNERGEIPLHHAARYGGDRMTRYIAGKSDIGAADHDGHSPLHAAVLGIDNEDGVRAMIDVKPSLDAKDRNGQTPLHLIAAKTRTRPADIGVAKLLINAGANLWARDADGMTAFEVASNGFAQRREVHQELVQMLRPKGREPAQAPPEQKTKKK